MILAIWTAWESLGMAQKATAKNRLPMRKIIRIEETKIEGRIQKPQAFYILQRSNLNFQSLELNQSFVPKVLESTGRPPF